MSFFDRILESVINFVTGKPRGREERLDEPEFIRKFVSGLFYCGGKKRQFFAVTYEEDDADRELELLQFLEETYRNCSDMRSNHGYSEDFESPDNESHIWPNIETGEL